MAQASVDRDGVFKVVEGYELEQHTMSGWVLVEALRESDVVTGMDEALHPQFANHDFQSNSYYCGVEKVHLDKTHVVGRTRFLLRKNPDSVVAEAVAEVAEMEARVAEMDRERAAALERVGVIEEQVTKLTRDVEYKNSQIERMDGECTTAREQRRKMEADLAKVRQAVGELKMKEILAAEE